MKKIFLIALTTCVSLSSHALVPLGLWRSNHLITEPRGVITLKQVGDDEFSVMESCQDQDYLRNIKDLVKQGFRHQVKSNTIFGFDYLSMDYREHRFDILKKEDVENRFQCFGPTKYVSFTNMTDNTLETKKLVYEFRRVNSKTINMSIKSKGE